VTVAGAKHSKYLLQFYLAGQVIYTSGTEIRSATSGASFI